MLRRISLRTTAGRRLEPPSLFSRLGTIGVVVVSLHCGKRKCWQYRPPPVVSSGASCKSHPLEKQTVHFLINQSLAERVPAATTGLAQGMVSPRTPAPARAGVGKLISTNRPQDHSVSHHRA